MNNNKESMVMHPEKKYSFVPKLRFPEFREAAQWKFVPLKKQATRCTQRNRSGAITRVLTNSAEFGIVDQRDYFDKDIATQGNLESYLIVEEGDYVYNPRISVAAPVGPISKNNVGSGVMSPLYSVFRFEDSDNDFYAYYFKTTGWHQYMRQASSTGARHDRMAITNDDFMAMPLPASTPEEQQKIADVLASLDDRISLEAKKLSSLSAHKKAMTQQLFPADGETVPRRRFPEFGEPWTEAKLESLCSSISSGRDQLDPNGTIDLYGSTSVIGKTTTSSYSGERILVARVGANAGLLTKVSGEFGVTDNTLVISVTPSNNIDFLFHYLGNVNINRLIFGSGQPLITGTMLKNLPIPIPAASEQQRISACLSALDEVIGYQNCKLEAIKAYKSGLMQQLFPSLAEIQA